MNEVLRRLLDPILEQIGKLWARADLAPVIRWGTVTQASPLRVQLDGDSSPLIVTPQTTIVDLKVGERVLCVEQNRRVVIAQVAGRTLTAKDTPWTALTLNSGWSTYAGERAYFRIQGGICYLIGRVSGDTSAGTTIGQLPAAARPTSAPLSMIWNTHSDNGSTIMIVDVSGNVVIASRVGLARAGVSLAGISFPVG